MAFFIPADVRAVTDSLDRGDIWLPYYIGGELYFLTHQRTRLRVWAQNRPYGLEIWNRDGVSIYGGVTFLSSFGLSIGRWALLFAIRRWERRNHSSSYSLRSAAQILRGETTAASSASPLAEGSTLHLNDARMEKGQDHGN